MPSGLSGSGTGGSTTTNVRTNSGTPGTTTTIYYPDLATPIKAMRLGGSRPTWDDYGVIFIEEIVNPPAGSEAPVIYSKLNLFVADATIVSLQVRGV